MPNPLLIDYLDRIGADYLIESHPIAFTASEVAQFGRVQGRNFAKVVIVNVDGELCMLVLPAHYYVAFEALSSALCARQVSLASERQFAHRFPRCEPGAMPPFGHLYGLRTLMVPVFEQRELIAFRAGSHSELLKMPYRQFVRFAHIELIADGVMPPVVPQLNTPVQPRVWPVAV